jgi:hypothetical protein
MEIFQQELISEFINNLETDNMKKLAKLIFDNIPDYWYDVPASSSGKYHNFDCVGEHGLFIHSWRTKEFMNHILTIEQYKDKFSPEERDCLRIGAFVHDGEKQGNGEGKHTVFEHPILMSNTILSYKGKIDNVDDSIIELMAKAVASHTGEWNTSKRSKIELPKPQSLAEELLHLCDYLASRKGVIVELPIDAPKAKLPTPQEYVFSFGKHNGETLQDVVLKDYSYISWLKENYHKEPLKTLLNKV